MKHQENKTLPDGNQASCANYTTGLTNIIKQMDIEKLMQMQPRIWWAISSYIIKQMDIEKLMPASKLEVKYLVRWDNGVQLMVSRGVPRDYLDADGNNLIGEGDIIELRMECDSPDVEDVALELSEETSFEVARGVVKALLCDKNLIGKVKFLRDLLRG